MDSRGARRSRPAAHARRAPWPPTDDPGEPGQQPAPAQQPAPGQLPAPAQQPAPGQLIGPGTGGYRVLEAGGGVLSGPQRVLGPGSGPQRVLGPGSGPQPILERTPVRGFPPLPPRYTEPPTGPLGTGPLGTGPLGTGEPEAAEDDGPVPPASIAPGPGRRGARAAGRPGRRLRGVAWLAAAAVVLVAGGGYAGYKYLYEPRVNAPVPSTLRLPTSAPASPGFDQALGKWQHIGTRTEDPQPLTLDQLFPPQFELNGSSYLRTAANLTKDCTQAVFGADLQAALHAGHCTQVLRASYISGNGTMMGTIGVANLTSSSAAQKAGKTTGPQEIIAPLAAKKGPTHKLGNGTGVVQAEIKGHYLILMWAEFTSLKSPSTAAQRQQLEQFASNLLTGSANIDLSTRMLTGKP